MKIKILSLLGVSVLSVPFLCSFVFAGHDVNKLYVYNWWNYFGKNTLSDFEHKYHVRIVYEEYKSNEEMLDKLIAGGVKVYDVVFPTAQYVGVMRKLNLLAKLNHNEIPNMTLVKSELLNRDYDPHNKYSLPYQWCVAGIVYRKDLVTITEPSLSLIFDPPEVLKGKIGVVDSMREVIGSALIYNGYSMNSTNLEKLAVARKTLLKVKPYINVIETDLMPGIVDGSIWVAITWHGEALLARSEHPNIDFEVPKEGAILGYDSAVIPINAPHKELAHKFINYLLDPKVSAGISNDIYYNSPVRTATNYILDERVKLYVKQPPSQLFSNFDYLKDVGPAITEYNKIWREFKRGSSSQRKD